MRRSVFVLVALLAGCSGRMASDMSSASEPGLDVARAAMQGGSPQIALQVTGNILAHDPDNEAALVVQGDALTALGRPDEATINYNKALRRNAASVGADVGLGRLQLSKNPAAAEARFLEALQHDPRNTTALNDLGVARDLQGHHAAAQAAYGQALGITPEDSAAQINLALSLAMSGASNDAVRMLRPLASEPGASRKLRHDLAAVLAMAGERDEAAKILSSDLSPEDVRRALNAYVAARTGGTLPVVVEMPQTAPHPTVIAAPLTARAQASGGVRVQFSAAVSEDAAHAEWQRLQKRMPNLLGGRTPEFPHMERDGHVFWRVRTGGFPDLRKAEAFCQQVRNAGGPCAVAGP